MRPRFHKRGHGKRRVVITKTRLDAVSEPI